MIFSTTGQEKVDHLIQVTTCAGLTVEMTHIPVIYHLLTINAFFGGQEIENDSP